MAPRSRKPASVTMRSPASRRYWHGRLARQGVAYRANTGSRWSSRQMRSTFATGGCGAMSAKRHPALSAWLAIRTKALSPRASQKDTPVRSSSSNLAWLAMAQPCSARASAVARSSSSGTRKTAIPAPEPAAVWVAPSVMTMPLCHRPLVAAIGVAVCRSAWHRTQRAARDEIPSRARPHPPPGDEPMRSAGPGERVQHWPGRFGLTEAQTRGSASRQRIPCRQLSARSTLAGYRAAPTSAVGLGLPTAGQAPRERRVQGESGLALLTAQDAGQLAEADKRLSLVAELHRTGGRRAGLFPARRSQGMG
jgi:hypothetical protein